MQILYRRKSNMNVASGERVCAGSSYRPGGSANLLQSFSLNSLDRYSSISGLDELLGSAFRPLLNQLLIYPADLGYLASLACQPLHMSIELFDLVVTRFHGHSASIPMRASPATSCSVRVYLHVVPEPVLKVRRDCSIRLHSPALTRHSAALTKGASRLAIRATFDGSKAHKNRRCLGSPPCRVGDLISALRYQWHLA